ncbi:UMF1 family MFS transporter [Tumebacillus sp. BK434]|uniref:MFS transporter n=1 Tax=Tumebacillus sp. BK434 TaxID=2512169 RepID=UPI001053E84C|nr:MFS transporter [Tumebacillus sp. BK434]TCP55448.1 UMF1 family MFS transporter [Tumebacillus sp. BK434]
MEPQIQRGTARNAGLFFSLPILAWAMYDLANTIFSMNIVSRYFPLFVTETLGQEDIMFSAAVSISMIFIALLSPLFGVLIDVRQKKRPYLITFTLLSILATGAIGVVGQMLGTHPSILYVGLGLFILANFAYNASLIFYNAQITDLGSRAEMGRISGFGVALGYVGTIIGLLAITPFVTGGVPDWVSTLLYLAPVEPGMEGGVNLNAFVPTALMFLVFSLPLFFLVKDRRTAAVDGQAFQGSIIKEGYSRVWRTFKSAREYKGLFRFLIAYFFFTDAINTVIAFMSVYAQGVMGLSASQLTLFLLVATAFAVVGSFIMGFVTDKIGSKRSIYVVLWLWVVALIIASVANTMPLFWVTGILIGIGMGSTWVSTRTLIVELSPVEKRGEFFGLFSLSGKVSAIVGPMVWGVITYLLRDYGDLGSRIAILSLLLFVLIGMWLMRKVPDGSKELV